MLFLLIKNMLNRISQR